MLLRPILLASPLLIFALCAAVARLSVSSPAPALVVASPPPPALWVWPETPETPRLPAVETPAAEWLTVVALVTAYTPGVESCGDSADGRTSTNRCTDLYPHGIAASADVLPPGTLIKVPEYMDVSFPGRAWEVDDTGGDMRRSFREHYIVHLDLRYRTVVSANKHGRQWMEISVSVTGWSAERRERLRYASHHGWWMREEGKLP